LLGTKGYVVVVVVDKKEHKKCAEYDKHQVLHELVITTNLISEG
jgi:hypothetical protein